MKNVPDVKLGILVGSTDWLPSEIAIENRKKLIETYKSKYRDEEIYECSICLTDNEVNIKRAKRELAKAECNAVCLYFANYGPESAGTLFAQEYDGPVMMIAAAEDGQEPYIRERKDALSGFINACYALKLRKTNVYIPSHPCGTHEQCADMISHFFPIVRTLIAVKDLKVVSIGPRPSSYLASSAPIQLLYDIGVEISEYSELEFLDAYKRHSDDKRIEKIMEEMWNELGQVEIPEILHNLAQYELTVDDWMRNYKGNRKYATMTSTCWPAFPGNFGFVPCYVNSRFTAKGYPIACEVDVYGAVSQYIGQCVSQDITTILNINNNIPKKVYDDKIKGREFNGRTYCLGDLFLGYHCGVTPVCKLDKPKLEYHFVNRQLIGEANSNGTIQGSVIPGSVTIFRIQGMRDGKMRAYAAQGQILPVEMDTYGGKGIIAIPEMERFIRNVIIEKQFPNHCAVLFGHYAEELIAIMKQLGISEIDYNHPKSMPYEKENMFSEFEDWY